VDLVHAPPLPEVADRLRASLEGQFLLTWFAEIEAAFLARIFGRRVRGWLDRSIDVRRLVFLADRLDGVGLPEVSYSLAEAMARAGLPREEAHDALNDAMMTAEMFPVVAARLARHGYQDVSSLLKQTRPA
jgi:DNA polymerase III epsilon subunit-like protein